MTTTEEVAASARAAVATALVPDPLVEPTMTVEQVGRALGVSRGLAYEAVKSGQIPSIAIGRRLVVPTAAFRRLVGLAD
jgi:excisionase family DNA binding protein